MSHPNPVNAIFEDSEGILWVGNVEAGINKNSKGTGHFTHILSKPGDPRSLSYNSISSIGEDHHQNLWFGTWGGGLNKLEKKDKNNPVFTQYKSIPYKDIKDNLFIAALLNDTLNNGLWVGTPLGLSFLDYATNQFYTVSPKGTDVRYINNLILDDKHRLWIGTGRGLYIFDLKKTDIKKEKYEYEYLSGILQKNGNSSVSKINVIRQSSNGTIWLGSANDGLFQVQESSPNQFNFINYGPEAGLSDYCIYSILEDNMGQLWMSTNFGLSVFNPTYNKAKGYSTKDGLLTNQFYWAACCSTRDGQLYFGHTKGLTHFYPVIFSEKEFSGIAHFTQVMILNDEVVPDNQALYLHERDKIFSIQFSAFNYEFPENIRYAYKLEGFDDLWNQGRIARYTNIPAGKYILKVKCSDENGVWSEKMTEMTIQIAPYFYKTTWFILLLIVLSLFAIYVFVVYRTRSLQNQKKRLEDTVESRTEEINQQKEILSEQKVELQFRLKELIEHEEEISHQNEMLIEQNTEISRQKDQLVELTEKVQEANNDKIAFFTNITHELKTPITLILGPIQRSLKLSSNPKVIEQLNLVERNSKLLLSLVNQLMDFRKIDSGNMPTNYTVSDFSLFVNELINPFIEIANNYEVRLEKYIRLKNPVFSFDQDNIGKIINNLLSNAIKYTPSGGNIRLFITELGRSTADKHQLYISVNDNGCGISEEDRERIFERFYQSKQRPVNTLYGQSGTGIGLFLCKRLTELMEGEICVKNNAGKGANFRLLLPLREETQPTETTDNTTEEDALFDNFDPEQEAEILFEQGKPTLLIIEDSIDMLTFIRSILSETYNVIESPDGTQGLSLLKEHNVDLIISDIMMPNMNGFELCKEVKSNFETSHIPVILLTAKSSTDARIEGYNVGADGFISKPFDSDLLEARINNILEARKRIQSKFLVKMDSSILNMSGDSDDKKFLDKAIEILKENYTDSEFDILKFTREMGVSRSLLHNKLISLVGLSASKFVRNYRLNTAKELLEANKKNKFMNISEIAYTVGFNDPKYFTRCFVNLFGITPGSILESAIKTDKAKSDTNKIK
ncbi:hypothetical protein FACS189463_1010 [Bacteroidia bacterium]|nr:hypothetical protein FACS189463_1010 [Bacteroidia bacterium]